MALIQDSTNPRFLSQGAISPEDLTRTSELPIEKPNPTGVYNVGSIADVPLQATASEQKISGLSEQLKELYGSQVGRSALQTSANRQFGVDTARQGINDLTAQLQGLRAEALAIPLNLQNQSAGITTGVLNTMTDAQLRTNAVKALNVQSLLAASQGQLANAQALADQAVAQKFDPIKEEIDAIERQLEIIKADPNTTREQQNRADRQRALQEEKRRQLEKDEANEKEVYNIGLTALKYGADIQTVQRIQQAKTPQEAIAIGGAALQDPMAKLELDKAKLDIILRNAEIQKTRAQTAQIGEEKKGKVLSVSDAKTLGVPYGTTDVQAAAMGKVPGTGGPENLTADQSKTRQFAISATAANRDLANAGYIPGAVGKSFLPNVLKGEKQQRFEQASRAFVNSILRRESGAVISDEEFLNKQRELIPMPGDKPATLIQKSNARIEAVKSLRESGLLQSGLDKDESAVLDEFYGDQASGASVAPPSSYFSN